MNLPRDTGISHSEMASKKDCSIYWFILSPEILGLEGNRVNRGWAWEFERPAATSADPKNEFATQ